MNADEIRDKHQRSAEGRAGCGVPAIFMVRAARRNVPEDRAERSMCVCLLFRLCFVSVSPLIMKMRRQTAEAVTFGPKHSEEG